MQQKRGDYCQRMHLSEWECIGQNIYLKAIQQDNFDIPKFSYGIDAV